MEIQSTPEYRTFVSHRMRVNERLRDTGTQIDDWISDHERRQASMAELAFLEGLLAERTKLLLELADLDASFMNSLLVLLQQNRAKEVETKNES